ncbi:lysophospholipase [Methylomarinum sp. Ch1-1]|uniref:Lysophospholipase n=1 Tax=Methylomarinum roseum TaxID=3067653 RepID=A0AAU7NQC2_9GAMM
MKIKVACPLFLLLIVYGCTPVVIKPGPDVGHGYLTEHAFVTEDGVKLALRSWQANDIEAVLIALHGFNDYRNFFDKPGDYFARRNITSYAYDQRGFGESPKRGYWSGIETYCEDLATFVNLIKARHPDTPVYLLGESMGGAVIINTMTRSIKPRVNGIILAAPAVWGRKTMPWYQTALLWSLSHSLPWLTLTGEDLEITPSDNIEMLKALGQDPLVIKKTRVDAIYGLTNLMDQALDNAELLNVDTLILYGEKDEIIPRQPTYLFLRNLLSADPSDKTIAFYQDGYHMLLRDLQAPVLWRDIAAWIESSTIPLPSGADKRAQQMLNINTLSLSSN